MLHFSSGNWRGIYFDKLLVNKASINLFKFDRLSVCPAKFTSTAVFINYHASGAWKISGRWETLYGGRPPRGKPPDTKEFSKICKIILKKFSKRYHSSIVLKRFWKLELNFLVFEQKKHKLAEFWDISKVCKKRLKKIGKNALF